MFYNKEAGIVEPNTEMEGTSVTYIERVWNMRRAVADVNYVVLR